MKLRLKEHICFLDLWPIFSNFSPFNQSANIHCGPAVCSVPEVTVGSKIDPVLALTIPQSRQRETLSKHQPIMNHERKVHSTPMEGPIRGRAARVTQRKWPHDVAAETRRWREEGWAFWERIWQSVRVWGGLHEGSWGAVTERQGA